MSGGGGGDDGTGVDLTALMDILSNIIFFLMASFGAAVIAMVPASVPTISEAGDNDVAAELDKVTLTMIVKVGGEVSVTVANSDVDPAELAQHSRTFAPVDGKIDAARLTEHLWSLKQRFPKSRDAIISPEKKVPYEMLIDAMDASRERHMKVDGKAVYPAMFPAVVVSSLVE
jgi:biopolymer transport protein ExbD